MHRLILVAVCLTVLVPLNKAQDEEIKVWLTTPLDRKNLLTSQTSLKWTTSDQSTAEHTVDIDDSSVYQEIDGLGATLSDSSAFLISKKLDSAKRQQLLTSLFDRRSGIALNTIRLAIGPSSFSLSNATYSDKCCSLDDFSIDKDKEYLIPLVKAAKKENPALLVFSLNWSPPAWMKDSDSLAGGILKPDQFSNLATYFTRYVQEYEKAGVPIYGLIVQNEPQYRRCCTPSMFMDAVDQAYFVSDSLRKIFDKYNINTKIIAATNNWDILKVYGDEFYNNKEAKDAVAGLAFQCYVGGPSAQTELKKKHPNKDLWLMECTDENTRQTFEETFRKNMNREVIGSLRHDARGIMKFNLLLDEHNGPQNGGCSNCAGMVTLNTNTNKLTYNAAYYAYGHLSKFVRAGAKRIQSTTTTGHTMETVAFRNPDGENVLLAYNNLKQYPIIIKAQWAGRFFSYQVPPYAAATFTWSGRKTKPRTAFERIQAESYSVGTGVVLENCMDVSGCGASVIKSSDAKGELLYRNIDFGKGADSITMRYASSNTNGLIEVRVNGLHGKDEMLALIVTEDTGNTQTWKTKLSNINKVEGVHDLSLVFKGNHVNELSINWIVFGKANKNTYQQPIQVSEDNVYKIITKVADKCLDVDKRERKVNTPVQQWDYYHVDWQKFYFNKSGSAGCYKIFVKSSGLVLKPSNVGDGQSVVIRQGEDTGSTQETWKILQTRDSYQKIVSCDDPNLVMEVDVKEQHNGALIVLAENSPMKLEQRFSLVLVDTFSA